MEAKSPSAIRRLWAVLNKPSAKYSVLSLAVVFFAGGIIFWGGFNTALEATNTLEFCTSCHEMRDTVYKELQQTIHWSNRTGVRAIGSDCHVPKDWTHKMIRKSKASFEVWGKLVGSIDTPEKFEARRMTLATHEWERMKDSGSRDEPGKAEGHTLQEAHGGQGGRQDLHRLPQGHRAPAAQGIQGPGRGLIPKSVAGRRDGVAAKFPID